MRNILISDLSPTGTEIAICVGAHYCYKDNSWDSKPYSYALVLAIKGTAETFLLKVPVSVGKSKGKELKKILLKNDVVGVTFKNPQIRFYSFTDAKSKKLIEGYTGIADDFTIIK